FRVSEQRRSAGREPAASRAYADRLEPLVQLRYVSGIERDTVWPRAVPLAIPVQSRARVVADRRQWLHQLEGEVADHHQACVAVERVRRVGVHEILWREHR